VDGFELLDAGDGRRLERFATYLVDRPAPGANAARRLPDAWVDADIRFEREAGWSGSGTATARHGWTLRLDGLTLGLRMSPAGQVGLFPEHSAMLPWLGDQVARRHDPTILNLFAYTGLATLALARAGASVAHVDAAKSAVSWARDNAAANGLGDAPIRWLVDDVRAFVAREVRRDRRYDGVVLDPPTYGHGTGGKAWRLERDLPALLDEIDRLLVADGFLLLTAHSGSLDPFALGGFLGANVEIGELALDAASGARLHLGSFARIDGGA
jgi:23S rRNA (cytosine1962-C5)-methyltransferase